MQFGSVIAFHTKIHQNNIFLFLKIIFKIRASKHIKKLIFSKIKKLIFLKNTDKITL